MFINQVFFFIFFCIECNILISDDHQMLYKYAACLLNSFFRVNGTIGNHFHDQFFKIGALFNPCIFYQVFYILDRSIDRINSNISKMRIFFFMLFSRHITTATANADLNI